MVHRGVCAALPVADRLHSAPHLGSLQGAAYATTGSSEAPNAHAPPVAGEVELDEETAKKQVRAMFKGWNVRECKPEDDRAGHWSISAEKGYLREAANLVFHLALVGILAAVGLGRLAYYEGQVIVVAGTEQSEFCNSAVSNFDSFRHGALFDGTGLTRSV